MSLPGLMHRLDAALDLRRQCIEKLRSFALSTERVDVSIWEMWMESLRDLDRLIERIKREAETAPDF